MQEVIYKDGSVQLAGLMKDEFYSNLNGMMSVSTMDIDSEDTQPTELPEYFKDIDISLGTVFDENHNVVDFQVVLGYNNLPMEMEDSEKEMMSNFYSMAHDMFVSKFGETDTERMSNICKTLGLEIIETYDSSIEVEPDTETPSLEEQ